MKKLSVQESLAELEQRMSLENRENDFNRARSISVGTSFGGTTELMMRMNNGRTVWAALQPVEVVELIHQLAANVGCHLMLKPRNDFASWRNWKVTESEKKHLNGHPPFVNDMAPFMDVGASLPPPEEQPGLIPAMMARSKADEQTVAVEKPIKRGRAKRSTTPT